MFVSYIPNILTILRIVLIPLFVAFLLYNKYHYALYIFIIGSVSDALDGYIARTTKSQSELGRLLDPLADKLLLITSVVVYSYIGWLPIWFTITVLSRDLFIIIGWILRYLVFNTLRIQPTFIGKTSIAMQMVLVAYILFDTIFPISVIVRVILLWVTAVLTVASGIHYIYKGLRYTNA